MISSSKWILGLATLAMSTLCGAQSAAPVLQRGYDANVSGANLSESTLNTSNVRVNSFGSLFNLHVDAGVWAQPLFVPNVAIQGLPGTHNVVYVATMNDTVYAFDADTGGAPLWTINLASLFSTTPVLWSNFIFAPVIPAHGNLGILSTPVIDSTTHIMYVVACTLENGTMAYRLHAIDITSGLEPYGDGVLITGYYGSATFDASHQTQRLSLVISGNQVIIGFGAMEEEENNPGYVGWVMSYDKTTLQESGKFATIANFSKDTRGGGGVWQSGRPPAVDGAGYVYLFAGNAYGNAGYDGVNNFSESVLKLDPSQGLLLVDWFTPSNWSYLDSNDQDTSSSGPMLIPGTAPTLLAGGGKSGILYVLNTANLGKYSAGDSQIVQEELITTSAAVPEGHINLGPVYWNRGAENGGPQMYHWGAEDVIRVYPFNGGTFAANPSAVGSGSAIPPGGALALSANGDQHGTGLLWATTNNPPPNGELHAFDAENISNEVWNSMMFPTRDSYGYFVKFLPPLVANGKVYVATLSNKVAVYGLGVAPPKFNVTPASLSFGDAQTTTMSATQPVTVTNTSSGALTITSITFSGTSASQFSQTNNCGTSVPVGISCAINVVLEPTAAGGQPATLNVSGGPGVTYSVALGGQGTVPFTLSAPSLAFGSVPVNASSAPQSVTVTNKGSAALPISSITFSGTNANSFSQTNTCGAPVLVGLTCTISVVFKPTSTGPQTATLKVVAPGYVHTSTLVGTGP